MKLIRLLFILLLVGSSLYAMEPKPVAPEVPAALQVPVVDVPAVPVAGDHVEPVVAPSSADELEVSLEDVQAQKLANIPMSRADWVQAVYRVGQLAVDRWPKHMCAALAASECFAQSATQFGCGSRLGALAYQLSRLGMAGLRATYVDQRLTPHNIACGVLRGTLALAGLWALMRQKWSLFGVLSPFNTVNLAVGAAAGCFFETVAQRVVHSNRVRPTLTTKATTYGLPVGLAGFQLLRLVV